MNDETYSEALAMSYRFEGERLLFEDGVSYTLGEALILARGRMSDDDMRILHLVKKAFDGEIESARIRKEPEPLPFRPVEPQTKQTSLFDPIEPVKPLEGSLDELAEKFGNLPELP